MQQKKNVSANLRRTATGRKKSQLQLLMMDHARSATKRRERQKQIVLGVGSPPGSSPAP